MRCSSSEVLISAAGRDRVLAGFCDLRKLDGDVGFGEGRNRVLLGLARDGLVLRSVVQVQPQLVRAFADGDPRLRQVIFGAEGLLTSATKTPFHSAAPSALLASWT